TAPEMPDGKDRLRARIALAFAALSLPAPTTALRAATRNLSEELDRQILPDGGHISRNPMVVLEILADLLPLRQTYANQAETPPTALMGAIDRMLPALRFCRPDDGRTAAPAASCRSPPSARQAASRPGWHRSGATAKGRRGFRERPSGCAKYGRRPARSAGRAPRPDCGWQRVVLLSAPAATRRRTPARYGRAAGPCRRAFPARLPANTVSARPATSGKTGRTETPRPAARPRNAAARR